jgi:hypothetical protein
MATSTTRIRIYLPTDAQYQHVNAYTHIQNDRKVTHPFLTHVLSKNKLHLSQETKPSAGNVHRSHRCMDSHFSSRLMQHGKELLCKGTVHRATYCRPVWHRRIGRSILKLILASKNEMTGSVRQWTLALVKKTSLHFDYFEDNGRTG